MVKCEYCMREMATPEPNDGCVFPYVLIDGKIYERIRNPYDGCDCNTKKGGIHHYGCDMEPCPVCGLQWIGCEEHIPQKLGVTPEALQADHPEAELVETDSELLKGVREEIIEEQRKSLESCEEP